MLGFKIDTETHKAWPVRVDGAEDYAREIGCPADGVRTVFLSIDGHEYAFVCRDAKYVHDGMMASVIDKRNKGVIIGTCIVFSTSGGKMRDLDVDECNQIYDAMYLISDGTTETEAVMVG